MKLGAAYTCCLRKAFRLLHFVCILVQVAYPVQPKEPADDAAIKLAIAPFASCTTAYCVFDYLDRIRPAPIKNSDKPYLLRNMEIVTGVNAVHDTELLSKLKMRIRPALALHRRSQVVDLYVFRYDQPGAMNKAGAFIAISTTMLRLIGDDDAALIGVVCHELAHEYVASDYWYAAHKHDITKMQELELFCDAVAAASLIDLGLDPGHYVSLLEHSVSFSPEMSELNSGDHEMPNIGIRKRLIDTLTVQLTETSSNEKYGILLRSRILNASSQKADARLLSLFPGSRSCVLLNEPCAVNFPKFIINLIGA